MLLSVGDPLFMQMQKTKVILTGILFLALALLLVTTWARNKQWLNDITLYESVVRQSPRKSRAYNNLGRALYLHGRSENAQQVLELALQYDPQNVDAVNSLAVVHLDRDEFDKAISYAMRALQMRPDSADVHNTLGEVYMKMAEFNKAFSHFRVSISLGPSNPDRYYNAAMALDALDRQNEACGYLEKYLARVHAGADVDDAVLHMRRMNCK